jgi:hypothetical protein
MAYVWTFNPHSGGTPIPPKFHETIRQRIFARAGELQIPSKYRIDVRFKSKFCYIDAYENDDKVPTHLCRLRYFGDVEKWTFAFYTYSNEQYTPCAYPSGGWSGTPEDAFEASGMYLA